MPSVLSILPEYKGLTTEDITNMYSAYNTGLEKAREKRDSAYEKYGEAYSKLGALRSILEKYKKTGDEENADQGYIDQYNAYVQGLEDSVNALMQNGYNTKSAWDIARLSGDFYNMYTPISAADTARTAAIKAYNEKMQDNRHVASYNPNESSLSDYINGSNKTPTYVSYEDIYTQAYNIAAAYAKRHQYYDFKSIQDEKNQFEAGDYKYGIKTKVTGFGNSYNIMKDDFLSKQVDRILNDYGLTKENGFTSGAIESAKKQIYSGYQDGITYSIDSDLQNVGYSDNYKKEAANSKQAQKDLAKAQGLVSTAVLCENLKDMGRATQKEHSKNTLVWSINLNNLGEDPYTKNSEKAQGVVYVYSDGTVDFYNATKQLLHFSAGNAAEFEKDIKRYFKGRDDDKDYYKADYRKDYNDAFKKVYGQERPEVSDADVIGFLAAYNGLVDNKIPDAALVSQYSDDDSDEDEYGGGTPEVTTSSKVDPQFDFDD